MKSRLFLGIFALIGSAAFGAFSENSRQGSEPIFSISGQGVEVLNPTDSGSEDNGSENCASLNNYAKILTSFLFQGHRWENLSCQYWHRNRFYNPRYGRFSSSDPVSFRGSNKLCNFANKNPLRWLAPWGLAPLAESARKNLKSKPGSPRMAKENDWSLLSEGGEVLRPNFFEVMVASSDQMLFASLRIRRNFYRN